MSTPAKRLAVCYPWRQTNKNGRIVNQILLGKHKDTAGARALRMVNTDNGPGGKFSEAKGDKDLIDCAIRETREETELRLRRDCVVLAGVVEIDNNGTLVEVSFFFAHSWDGEHVTESDELYDIGFYDMGDLPYGNMMDADRTLALPHVLLAAMFGGVVFHAHVTHNEDMKVVGIKDIRYALAA